MRPLHVAWVVVAIAVAATACGGESASDGEDFFQVSASSVSFESLDEMAAASEIVVIGTVTEVADGDLHEAPSGEDFIGTRDLAVSVDVEHVLKGEAEAGDTVTVPWIGYEIEADGSKGPQIVINGQFPPDVGDRNVWFLGLGDGGTTFGLVAYAGRIEITDDEKLLPFEVDSGAGEEVDGMTMAELQQELDRTASG